MQGSDFDRIGTLGRPSAQETVSVESDASDPPVLRRRRGGAGDGRKADTQARILEAAVALFAARGYERTSISAIATRAGVSRAAIFWHFGDKDSLFQEAFRSMLVPFLAELKRSVEHIDPRTRFFELFDVYEAFVSTHREVIQSIVRWVFESSELRARLQRPLLGLVDEFVRDVRGSLEEIAGDDPDVAALAAALASALHGNLLLSLLDPSEDRRALRNAGIRRLAERALGPGCEKP
jgi:AcrR family transcriptional regulator